MTIAGQVVAGYAISAVGDFNGQVGYRLGNVNTGALAHSVVRIVCDTTTAEFQVTSDANVADPGALKLTSQGRVVVGTSGANNIEFRVGGTSTNTFTRWQILGTGGSEHFTPGADDSLDIGVTTLRPSALVLGTGGITVGDEAEQEG